MSADPLPIIRGIPQSGEGREVVTFDLTLGSFLVVTVNL